MIALSRQLAARLGLKIGDPLRLETQTGTVIFQRRLPARLRRGRPRCR
ncbi:MAG: hypothetical protein WDO13_05110 [Verrucomicrobiota bacterium]